MADKYHWIFSFLATYCLFPHWLGGKRKRPIMLRHTSAAEHASVYGPITAACMFMSQGSSEGGQPLFILLLSGWDRVCFYYVRLRSYGKGCLCKTKGFFLLKVTFNSWDDKWISKYQEIPHLLDHLINPQRKPVCCIPSVQTSLKTAQLSPHGFS